MQGKELTPQSLAFWSFHHSQGDPSVQRYIFAYSWKTEHMKPNLKPDAQEIGRYATFLDSKQHGSRRHLEFSDPGETTEDNVISAFKQLRSEIRKDKKLYKRSLEEVVSNLGYFMLGVESKIFDTEQVWTNVHGIDRGRQARADSRVASGHPSFLFKHGRDEQPTGFRIFDQMYAAVWEQVNDDNLVGEIQQRRDRHADLIAQSLVVL